MNIEKKASTFINPKSPVWHPFTQMGLEHDFPIVLSAKGAHLHLQDGRRLIDAISSWWVITHGHCDPYIVAAISRQASQLDQVIFAGLTHPKAEELAERLIALTPPELSRVFYSDNGSTAVEVALKMALQYQAHRGQPQRRRFLAFAEAYHGDTVGAMSVGAAGPFTDPFRPLLFDVIRAQHPTRSGHPVSEWVADFDRHLAAEGDKLAGVILEPLLQAAGGMIVWPLEAVRHIATRCREAQIPLIYDEVMTGFGRTGSLFALDQVGIAPDFLCLSKGLTAGMLPLSVTLTTEPVFEAFRSTDRGKTFWHGHSFTANPIACAAAIANLERFESGNLPAQWKRIETLHRQRCAALSSAARERLSDCRILGTLAALELRNPQSGYLANGTSQLRQKAFEAGILLRPLGNVIYLLPPYCIEDADLHLCWDFLEPYLLSLHLS